MARSKVFRNGVAAILGVALLGASGCFLPPSGPGPAQLTVVVEDQQNQTCVPVSGDPTLMTCTLDLLVKVTNTGGTESPTFLEFLVPQIPSTTLQTTCNNPPTLTPGSSCTGTVHLTRANIAATTPSPLFVGSVVANYGPVVGAVDFSSAGTP